jgi:hypothetical protein
MMLLGLWQLTANVSAQQSLTLAMVLTGLQTKGNKPETATLAARNVYITKRVQAVGVTFRVTPEIDRELRNAGATNALIAAIRQNGPAAPTPTTKPSASFKDIWIDYDVKEGTQNGMRIHVKFTTYAMKNIPGFLAIYFMKEDGTYLKDKNGKFVSSSNDVAVYRELTPAYDPADFNDLTVFMPYAELDLTNGNWKLTMDVKLIYKAGGLIQDLTKEPFIYKQGAAAVRNPDSVTATVNRIWVDYNVTEGGKRGMRIHVNFEVTGLQGVGSRLYARVMKQNGDFLTNSNSLYSNKDGHLAVFFDMNPGFSTTVYKDATMFLPYSEIIIGRGKHALKFDIDLNYDDGELIKHLDVYEFEFERP